jgi:hypothetical protein
MRWSIAASAASVIVVLLTIPKGVAAQVWSVDVYAGQANYKTLPASVSSGTGVLGVRFNQDRRIFQAALGLPLAKKDVTWGVVGFGDRLALRRGGFVAGADVSVLAHAQRDPVANITGQGLVAEVLPVISQSIGAGSLELRSGPRWYGSRLGDTDWTRRLWTTEFRGGVQAGEAVRVEADVRHDRAPQRENYTRAAVSLAAMVGRVAVQGAVGHWIDGVAEAEPEWDASISVPIRPSVWIFTSAQRESFNPLFLGPPRTSWSAGVTFRIGGRPEPVPARAIETEQQGRVVVRVPVREAPASLSIAGDFTGWMPVPMERQGNEWRFPLTLAPGVYRFAFRSADGEWFVPESIPNRTDDGMGGSVAVMVVP